MNAQDDRPESENQMIQDEFNRLIDDYCHSNHRRKIERITKAFNFANQAHKGVRRRSGEPYIMHPLAVARIVCNEMGLGSTSICCALLHDVVEDTEYTVENIRDMFDDKIAQIVDGLTKISGVVFEEHASAQAENFRKLLLTMSSDIRVILIKLADRLHNMRTLSSMLPAKQYKIAGETLYLYAPLAHRLGLFAIKTELENLSFKYEHPREYELINQKLAATEAARNRLFDRFAKPVDEKLHAMGLQYEMRARVKSAYSIWNKMNAKKVPFEDIYDIFAVRIVFEPKEGIDEKNLCWDIYSAITDIYRIRPDRLRDWVSRPKSNGYQALHLTVMGPDGQWIEIQIRSHRMDDIAEKGFAAHWKYKEKHVEEDTELDKWLATITEILENPNPDSLDFLDTVKMNLFSSEIFVFTPKGELKTLPQGATALDFAYALHTDIGDTCIGAKVNHRLVPLSHKLSSGDQVEVLTSHSQKPAAEWLNYVVTAKARSKIEAYLKRVRREVAKEGEVKLLAALHKSGFDAPASSLLDKIAVYYGFPTREGLYYAIEKGEVALPDNFKKIVQEKTDNVLFKYLKQALRMGRKREMMTILPASSGPKKELPKYDRKKPYRLCEDEFNRNYVIAGCCKPIPGDEALGFINDDGNVVVHKISCPIALRLKSSFGERILSTVWSNHINTSFEATLEVKGIDSIGVLNTITRTISDSFNVNITKLTIEAKDGVFEGKIKMLVHNVEDIQNMCVTLSKNTHIKSVARVAD
ncbi:GTP pyrophosphokinase [Tannerella sp. oral taxon 808]|nr:GTP pyrophosphokinase [Tannerella sp. oral taxon 808]